jgi:hypothetical protein
MKRTGFLAVAVSCAIFIGIFAASPSRVEAGDAVDCSKATKWVSGEYNTGALVTYKKGMSSPPYEFRCNSSSCKGEPTKYSEWKEQGQCKSGTEPK